MNALAATQKHGHVLITGASRGIGAACAAALAKARFDVVLWARSEPDLHATRDVCASHGVDARAAVVDVSDPQSVFGPGAASLAGLNSLRGCILNAGVGIWGNVTDFSVQDWRSVVATNLDGAFYSLKVSLPLLLQNPHGQILTMGSDSGLTGYPERGAYCASKSGLHGFLAAVRRETRGDGIRITNLVMSRVDTFFRSKKPGNRPNSLSVDDVARVVEWVFLAPSKVEIREVQLSAIAESFGPYPEAAKEIS
jgi:NADP-dependent 3-hydroxy acid dehydrogenase YdfG